jgi:hypothetical protein
VLHQQLQRSNEQSEEIAGAERLLADLEQRQIDAVRELAELRR